MTSVTTNCPGACGRPHDDYPCADGVDRRVFDAESESAGAQLMLQGLRNAKTEAAVKAAMSVFGCREGAIFIDGSDPEPSPVCALSAHQPLEWVNGMCPVAAAAVKAALKVAEINEFKHLRATIARVEAVDESWRELATGTMPEPMRHTLMVCRDDLNNALYAKAGTE